MNNKRENPKPFVPVEGEIYENAAGGKYLCRTGRETEDWGPVGFLINIKSGWSFKAKNIVRYDDGTIEWGHSTDGYFLPVDDVLQRDIDRALQREIDRKVSRAVMRATQHSMLNALLCCLI